MTKTTNATCQSCGLTQPRGFCCAACGFADWAPAPAPAAPPAPEPALGTAPTEPPPAPTTTPIDPPKRGAPARGRH